MVRKGKGISPKIAISPPHHNYIFDNDQTSRHICQYPLNVMRRGKCMLTPYSIHCMAIILKSNLCDNNLEVPGTKKFYFVTTLRSSLFEVL
jgi:hypothetical protein